MNRYFNRIFGYKTFSIFLHLAYFVDLDLATVDMRSFQMIKIFFPLVELFEGAKSQSFLNRVTFTEGLSTGENITVFSSN